MKQAHEEDGQTEGQHTQGQTERQLIEFSQPASAKPAEPMLREP